MPRSVERPARESEGAAAPGVGGVFVDRDGTVCEEVGYVNHVSRCTLLPRSAEAIRLLNQAGLKIAIVTNQAGVARGYFEERMVVAVHAHLRELLAAQGGHVDEIYACLHHPTAGEPPFRADCECRKPRPGMLVNGAREMGVDLARSYMIGDSARDISAGHAAGATPILVMTGYGRGEWEHQRQRFPVPPAFVAEDLLDAVRWILAREGRTL